MTARCQAAYQRLAPEDRLPAEVIAAAVVVGPTDTLPLMLTTPEVLSNLRAFPPVVPAVTTKGLPVTGVPLTVTG